MNLYLITKRVTWRQGGESEDVTVGVAIAQHPEVARRLVPHDAWPQETWHMEPAEIRVIGLIDERELGPEVPRFYRRMS